LNIRQHIPAAQPDAGQFLDTVNYLLEKDGEAFHKAQHTGNDDDRTRLVRLGASSSAISSRWCVKWAQYTAALGAQQQPLLGLAQRGADLGGKLLAKLQ